MQPPEANEENVRTEYAAICSNLNQLASFRFSLVGFYVAALGLIASGNPDRGTYLLMVWISLCFWVLELRNRQLHANMAERAMQIERTYWHYSTYEAFVSHWSRKKPSPEASKLPSLTRVPLFGLRVPLPVSHSFGLDLLFLGVMVYAILRMVVQ